MAARKAEKAIEESGGFRGFGSQALPFLLALKENNDREWFAEQKSTFVEECDVPIRELVREVGSKLAEAGSPFAPVPKNPVFRIYRDVRFSNDKSPYKTNLGASLHREGVKARPGILYIHVEPAGSFLAAGFYHPEPPTLKELRQAVADDPAKFESTLRTLAKSKLEPTAGEPLARMPKGFEAFADSAVAEYLRYRSFLLSRPLQDEDLERRDLPDTVVKFARDASPFLEFFWSRIPG